MVARHDFALVRKAGLGIPFCVGWACVLAVGLTSLIGCSGDDPVIPPPPEVVCPTPATVGARSYDAGATGVLCTKNNVQSLDIDEDFTVECWVNLSQVSQFEDWGTVVRDDGYELQINSPSGSAEWEVEFTISMPIAGGIRVVSVTLLFRTPPPIGVWMHIAAQLKQATGRMDIAVNGDFSLGRVDDPTALFKGSKPLCVGSDFASRAFKGRIDCLRISAGLRYSGDFTPPATEFTRDTSTRGLWYFNETKPPHLAASCSADTRLERQ